MSWNYGPGGYQGSPYVTYPAFGPTVNAQDSKTHTQASTVASTSARPYVPPPLPQNSAPPVQSAPFYRPPTTTIRSSVQLNRPAYLDPALTPSFTPPPSQFWNYDAVPSISSAPLPPTYPPPSPRPPIEPSEVGKEALPPDKQMHGGGVGKKRKKKKNKMEKSNETQKAFVTPAGAANNPSFSIDLSRFLKSIIVIGQPGQITSIRMRNTPQDNPEEGYRVLNGNEKAKLRSHAENISSALRQRDVEERAWEGTIDALRDTSEGEAEMDLDSGDERLEAPSISAITTSSNLTSSIPLERDNSTETSFLSLEDYALPYLEEIEKGSFQRDRANNLHKEEKRQNEGEGGIQKDMMMSKEGQSRAREVAKEETRSVPFVDAEEKAHWNKQKLYLNSIVVTGSIGQLISIRRLDSLDRPLVNPERFLSKDERKDMNHYLRNLIKAAERKERQQRWKGASGIPENEQQDGVLGNGEADEDLRISIVDQKPSAVLSDLPTHNSESATSAFLSLEVFVRPYFEEINHLKLERKIMAKLEREVAKGEQEDGRMRVHNEQGRMSGWTEEKDDLGSRVGVVATSISQPLLPSADPFIDEAARAPQSIEGTRQVQVDSKPRDSEPQDTPIPPPLSTPPFASSLIPVLSSQQLLSAISTDKTNGGLESSSVPDSTLPSSVTLVSVDPSSAPSLSAPTSTVAIASPLPNPDSFPRDSISPVQHSPSRKSSLVPPLVPPLVPTLVPAAVKEGADLEPSLDIDAVVIKQETSEASTSKEGESRMGQDETCELEVKKESTASAEDLRAIKEEEDQKDEPPQFGQRSSSLAELASPPTDPQASLDSLELEMQVGNTTHKRDDVEAPSREDAGVSREEVSTGPNEKAPPSSDLSEVDEGAISQSGSEDSAGDSITEVLAKRKARRVSSASTVRPEKKRAKLLPDYLDELLEEEENYNLWWDDPSVSESAKAFILERETIFGLQRSFVDSGRQQAAMQLVTSSTNAVTQQTLRSYLAVLSTYLSFCAIATVPPFPISSPMIALYLYQYRAQWPEVNRVNNPAALRFFARRISHLFDDDSEVYKQLESWPDSDTLIRELKKPIETSKGSVSTRSDAPRMSRNSSSSRISSTGPSNVSSGRKNLDKSKPRSTSRQFELVVPERRDSRRAERPSMSPMVIASSISFASTKLATTIDLSNIPLPNIGDSFKSRRAVKMSTAAAIIFSQGYSVSTDSTSDSISVYCEGPGEAGNSCTFRVHASRDSNSEEWLIDETSNKHTHEPSQALKDVDWRPSTEDRDIIEAMWQVDQRGQLDESLRKLVAQKRSQVSPQEEIRPSKKPRTLSPSTSERFASERPSLTYSPIPPRSSAEPSRRATSPSPFENGKLLPASSSTLPALEASTDSLPLPQLLSDDPFYYRPAGPEVMTSASDMLVLSTPPAPQLVSFLKSLDPSLPPLAPLLQASGYSTLGSLVELAAMEADTRERLYREIVIRGGKVDSELFDLLERRFVEALAGDWKD